MNGDRGTNRAGRVALITGAQQGIGKAIAQRLNHDGARVAVNDIALTSALQATAQELNGLAVPADVADSSAVGDMITRTEKELGPIGILVCNAAVEALGSLTEQEPAAWWRHLDVNLTGTINLVQAVLPSMRRHGGGHIVILASIWGYTGWARASGYSASKTGLIGLTAALGPELRREGITVSAIAPGIIDAPQIRVDAEDFGITLEEMREQYSAGIPVGRLGSTAEIATAVSFLTTHAAQHYSGQILHANGGEYRSSPA